MRTPLAALLALVPATARAGLAQAGWWIVQEGAVRPRAPQVLVVVTPGIAPGAFSPWVEALEGRGLDAWSLRGLGTLEGLADAAAAVDAAVAELAGIASAPGGAGRVRLAAHGVGGLAALLAEPSVDRMALVAVPLAPWPDPPAPYDPPEGPGLPFPDAWLGPHERRPLHPALAAEVARLPWSVPPLPAPACPVLLVASAADPLAPPEIVRLPSAGWPDRAFHRAGLLSLEGEAPRHVELLASRPITRSVAAHLAGEAP